MGALLGETSFQRGIHMTQNLNLNYSMPYVDLPAFALIPSQPKNNSINTDIYTDCRAIIPSFKRSSYTDTGHSYDRAQKC